jgi:hypothetical protein
MAWGCPPTKPKEGASRHPLQPRHEWDPKRWQTLSLRGWANGGGGGASPLPGGLGGAPKNQNRGRAATTPCNPATSGTQNSGKPSATGVGKRGVQGGKAPMAGGVGGVPPQNQRRGRAATPCNPATSGTQNPGKPSAYGGGQTGVQGAQPPPRGFGGCAPKNQNRGRAAHISNPATSGTQSRWQTLSPRGWGGGVKLEKGGKP